MWEWVLAGVLSTDGVREQEDFDTFTKLGGLGTSRRVNFTPHCLRNNPNEVSVARRIIM